MANCGRTKDRAVILLGPPEPAKEHRPRESIEHYGIPRISREIFAGACERWTGACCKVKGLMEQGKMVPGRVAVHMSRTG